MAAEAAAHDQLTGAWIAAGAGIPCGPGDDGATGGSPDRAGHPATLAPMADATLYAAGACLVAAQLLGIYGLVTRKADLIFALVMGALLVGAVALGGMDVYHRIH